MFTQMFKIAVIKFKFESIRIRVSFSERDMWKLNTPFTFRYVKESTITAPSNIDKE